jgi:hypothetical protein
MVLRGPQPQGSFPMTSPNPVFPALPPVKEFKEKFSQGCDTRSYSTTISNVFQLQVDYSTRAST